MDRLRRRLGHDVPVSLVFPNIIAEEPEEDDRSSRPSGLSGPDLARSFIQTPPPPPQIPEESIATAQTPPPPSPPPYIPLPSALESRNRFATVRDSILFIDAPRRSSREEPPKPSLDYSSPTGDFLSLVDDDDTEEEEDEEEVIVLGRDSFLGCEPIRKEKENRIAAWAQQVSRTARTVKPPSPTTSQPHKPSVPRASAWFEDEDESDYNDARTQLSNPSTPTDSPIHDNSPQSLKTDMFLPYAGSNSLSVPGKTDSLDLIEDDASAAFLLSYHGQTQRWEWGVPSLDPSGAKPGGLRASMISTDEVVGLEALAMAGMIF
jgi:hypothetical protein